MADFLDTAREVVTPFPGARPPLTIKRPSADAALAAAQSNLAISTHLANIAATRAAASGTNVDRLIALNHLTDALQALDDLRLLLAPRAPSDDEPAARGIVRDMLAASVTDLSPSPDSAA